MPFLLLISLCSQAQDINVEYDKKRDLSRYKTFSLGGGEVITPKDQQQGNEASLKNWVRNSIAEELKGYLLCASGSRIEVKRPSVKKTI